MRHETGLTRVSFSSRREKKHELEIDPRVVDAPRTPHGGNIGVQVRGLAGCCLFVRPSAL